MKLSFCLVAGLVASLALSAPMSAKAQQYKCAHLGGDIIPSGAQAAATQWWVNGATRLSRDGTYLLKFFPGQPGSNGHWFRRAATNSAGFKRADAWGETFDFRVVMRGGRTTDFCHFIRTTCRPNPVFRAQLPCF